MIGPAYRSTLKDEAVGNTYVALGDEWGQKMYVQNLDQLVVIVDTAVGNEAQVRFWSNDHPGQPLPLPAGLNARTDQARFGFDAVEFRNALAGAVAHVHIDVTGLKSRGGNL